MTVKKKSYTRVLTIAGSDSGGGAGIQADLKTISANGCYGMSVITALTAQNTEGVLGIHPVPVDFVIKQMEAVLSDIGTDAVKIGMLYSPELIEAVATTLKRFKVSNIVLDPVMIAQSGDRLLKEDAVQAIREILIPLADVVTPNIPEAFELLGGKPELGRNGEGIDQAAREISRLGCPYVWIKGGHLGGESCSDLLYMAGTDTVITFKGRRIETRNNHGTGCTLSSALASFMARGHGVRDAAKMAKEYICRAITAGAGYKIGHGHGPVHHFFNIAEQEQLNGSTCIIS